MLWQWYTVTDSKQLNTKTNCTTPLNFVAETLHLNCLQITRVDQT